MSLIGLQQDRPDKKNVIGIFRHEICQVHDLQDGEAEPLHALLIRDFK